MIVGGFFHLMLSRFRLLINVPIGLSVFVTIDGDRRNCRYTDIRLGIQYTQADIQYITIPFIVPEVGPSTN